MCLTRISEPKVAEENIFCYKTLHEGRRSIHNYYTYKLGKVQPLVKISESLSTRYGDSSKRIEAGYHSWVNEPVRPKKSYEKTYLCVIPKGTIYYTGLENDNEEGYVSETLVVLGPTQYGFFGKIGTELRRQKYINQK